MNAPVIDTSISAAKVADDVRGRNFFEIDHSLQSVLQVYCPEDLRQHMWPHLQRLGGIAGGRLDELADIAERHPPKLHYRDRFGRDTAGAAPTSA